MKSTKPWIMYTLSGAERTSMGRYKTEEAAERAAVGFIHEGVCNGYLIRLKGKETDLSLLVDIFNRGKNNEQVQDVH